MVQISSFYLFITLDLDQEFRAGSEPKSEVIFYFLVPEEHVDLAYQL